MEHMHEKFRPGNKASVSNTIDPLHVTSHPYTSIYFCIVAAILKVKNVLWCT